MSLKEDALALKAIREAAEERRVKKENAILREQQNELETREAIKSIDSNRAYFNNLYKMNLMESMLVAGMERIYIGALEKDNILEQSDYDLAESLVKNYIKESGGAFEVLSKMEGKTYLLDTLARVVKEAEEEAEENTDDDTKEAEAEAPEDSESAEDARKDMYDKLDKEEDVDAAVEIITQRVADAEEEFIKKNAEDKKKIEEIIAGINDRIASIKGDPTIDEEDKEEMEEALNHESYRLQAEAVDSRPHNIYETVFKNLYTSVNLEDALKATVLGEDSNVDMDRVNTKAKCIYTFYEFLNTCRLATVDDEFIKEEFSI